jgi:hypothetical protein
MYMQISRKLKISEPTRGLTLFSVFAVSALLGVLFGAICYCYVDSELSEQLKSAEYSLFSIRRSGNFSRILLTSLAGTGFYLAVAFFLGFSALSQPFELLIPFFHGVSSGVMLTQIYGGNFSKLLLLKAAAVLPGTLISLTVIILAGREAFYLSCKLFTACFHERLFDGLLKRIKLYTVRFFALLAAASVSSVVDCILAMLLL